MSFSSFPPSYSRSKLLSILISTLPFSLSPSHPSHSLSLPLNSPHSLPTLTPSPSLPQLEGDLADTRGKVDRLSAALDSEAGHRKQAEAESTQLRTQLDKANLSLQATSRR